ncbi:Uncharacterized protein QTN25_008720 [Entamoeba marina]
MDNHRQHISVGFDQYIHHKLSNTEVEIVRKQTESLEKENKEIKEKLFATSARQDEAMHQLNELVATKKSIGRSKLIQEQLDDVLNAPTQSPHPFGKDIINNYSTTKELTHFIDYPSSKHDEDASDFETYDDSSPSIKNDKEKKKEIELENPIKKRYPIVVTEDIYSLIEQRIREGNEAIKTMKIEKQFIVTTTQVNKKHSKYPFEINYEVVMELFTEHVQQKKGFRMLKGYPSIQSSILFNGYCTKSKLLNTFDLKNDEEKKIFMRVGVANFNKCVKKLEEMRVENGLKQNFGIIKDRYPHIQFIAIGVFS